jgi:medium-chain acyl-[acyl-carrier-protein] hydrolase
MIPIWRQNFVLGTYEADLNHKMKLSGFFNCFQEAAGLHAAELGAGFDAMLAKNAAWVLSKIKFEILRYPLIGDTITVETWPHGREKVIAARDMNFYCSGEKIGMGRSLWVLADLTSFRPRKLQDLIPDLPLNPTKSAIDASPEKLKIDFATVPVMDRTARYSETDINQHLNNARYVDWVADCFDVSMYASSEIQSIQINFLAQVLPGQTVRIQMGSDPADGRIFCFEGTDTESAKRCFEAKVVWRQT